MLLLLRLTANRRGEEVEEGAEEVMVVGWYGIRSRCTYFIRFRPTPRGVDIIGWLNSLRDDELRGREGLVYSNGSRAEHQPHESVRRRRGKGRTRD